MRNLLEHNKIYAGSCDNQLMSLYLQRNALISGGSVFLFLVMRRLLDIQVRQQCTRQCKAASKPATRSIHARGGDTAAASAASSLVLLCNHCAFARPCLLLLHAAPVNAQGQLFEMRSLVKEAAAQAEAPKLLDGPGASEQQRLLKSTLSRLDRGLESGGSFAKERVGVKTA